MSHGSPLGRGRLPPSVPHSTTARLLTRSPIHVSRPATGHMEGTQGAPHPTGVRSPTRSPIHVSRLATGHTWRRHKGRHTQPPFVCSLVRHVRSHGSPLRKREGTQGAPYATTGRSLARSLAKSCLTTRHRPHGGVAGAPHSFIARSLAHSPIYVSRIATGHMEGTQGASHSTIAR